MIGITHAAEDRGGSQSLNARGFLAAIADAGSWQPWDDKPAEPDLGPGYREELDRAKQLSGVDEAVLTGSASIGQRRVAIAVSEFSFMGGSIGVAAASRLVSAVERATRQGMPILAATASGGTRIQEGPLAFIKMANIVRAVVEHRRAGLPYLVFLRDPTFGGVFASLGSLGHVTVAEPGARIGFAGPRALAAMSDEPVPAGVQVAENLLRRGIIDAIATPAELRALVTAALDVLMPASPGPPAPGRSYSRPSASSPSAWSAWEVITRSRNPERPGTRDLLRHAGPCITPLFGTEAGTGGRGVAAALVRFGGVGAVVVGHDRARGATGNPAGPAALEMAQRAIRLAAEIQLPLVTVIDTSGAELSREAEEDGLSGEIARCLAALVLTCSPTLSVLLGQGAGGAALALMPADRVIAAEGSWLCPLAPEAASAVLYQTGAYAAETAENLSITAHGLLQASIVDEIIPEPADAATNPAPFLQSLVSLIEVELRGLLAQPATERMSARGRRYG